MMLDVIAAHARKYQKSGQHNCCGKERMAGKEDKLLHKGYLDKKKDGKSYFYWPVVSEPDVSQRMLGDMVSRVFDGSAKRLVLNLIDGEEIEERELLELRKLINQKVREQRK